MFIQIIFLCIISNVSVHLNAYQLFLPKKIIRCLKKQAIACNVMGENEKNSIMYVTKGEGYTFIDVYENLLKYPLKLISLKSLNNQFLFLLLINL